ncbi:phosphopentomutase [Bifidobacterium dolichotidis]|uniref:Phosphopentomutase n=1 Tax=Bifidobacterium dolichotidis TaxID=2306976 RepID=A0A430FPW4_9BIFI|nr:phosphopentomutase [Bifidobacterium dolichotidis]RSX54873.1 phosphopentomutase [Bifidobacterium dolichotidis]
MANPTDYRYPRVFAIALDSIGIGEAPDAAKFNDVGSDTLGHIGAYMKGGLKLPNMQRLGLGNIREDNPIEGVEPIEKPIGSFGKMTVTSWGNDSLDGHWEMMCLPVRFDMSFFPEGFPQEIVDKLEAFSGRKVIVNKPYSGTEVIKDYGEHQMETGDLILYTSGDSVLQIAAHEDVIPVDELYRICEYARTLINGPEIIMGRVIARPYVGPDKDHFVRTSNRHDYGLEPTEPTALDFLHDAGLDVLAVGKTYDIFSGHGFDRNWRNKSNMDGMDHVDEAMGLDFTGLCFTNLVDFDAMYGHRRNTEGDAQALMDFDRRLGTVLDNMRDDDLLIITADHGNDPTYEGTDHTREFVPLLAYSPSMKHPGESLGIRATASDMGATILENFHVEGNGNGTSFFEAIS